MIIENITVTVKRKNIKNMYLRVLPPNGDVTLSAPLFISDEEIISFVKSKKEWILKKQKYILDNDIKPPIKYDNGERHQLWGKEYTLQLISNENIKHVLIDEEKSIMYLPIGKRTSLDKRRKTMNEFYRTHMKMAVPSVLQKCTKIVGRKPTEVKI